jgi:hypothetical protein
VNELARPSVPTSASSGISRTPTHRRAKGFGRRATSSSSAGVAAASPQSLHREVKRNRRASELDSEIHSRNAGLAEQIAGAEAPFWRHVRDTVALLSADD